MSTHQPDPTGDDSDDPNGPAGKNAPLRAERRAARAEGRRRSRRTPRRLVVRSELRDTPDVRKIARAIITMALADAEREAQAQSDKTTQPDNTPSLEDKAQPESASE